MKKLIILLFTVIFGTESFSQYSIFKHDPILVGALDTIPVLALVTLNNEVRPYSLKLWQVNERVTPVYDDNGWSSYPLLNYWRLKKYLTESKDSFSTDATIWLTKELPYTSKVWESPIIKLEMRDSLFTLPVDTTFFKPGKFNHNVDSLLTWSGVGYNISDTTTSFTFFKKNYSFYSRQVLVSTISTGLVYCFRNVMVDVRYIKGQEYYYIKGKKFRPVNYQ